MNHKIATIHDISGYGRGSLTTAIPILSAMGFQCCPLPTSVLSSHTGIPGYTFRDLSCDMENYIAHWKRLRLEFDAIYTGFLGSEMQIEIIELMISSFKKQNTVVLVDPVMADNGELYETCSEALCREMGELIRTSDIITPNETEANVLLGLAPERHISNSGQALQVARALSEKGPRCVVITGLSYDDNSIGVLSYDASTNAAEFCSHSKIDAYYPGTGDLFASVLLGTYLKGASLAKSAKAAADFVHRCILYTKEHGTPAIEGVLFEQLLFHLIK